STPEPNDGSIQAAVVSVDRKVVVGVVRGSTVAVWDETGKPKSGPAPEPDWLLDRLCAPVPSADARPKPSQLRWPDMIHESAALDPRRRLMAREEKDEIVVRRVPDGHPWRRLPAVAKGPPFRRHDAATLAFSPDGKLAVKRKLFEYGEK